MEEEKQKWNQEYYDCGKMCHFSACCPNKKTHMSKRNHRAAEATMSEDLNEEDSGKEDPQE
jgi:hypothetical protein